MLRVIKKKKGKGKNLVSNHPFGNPGHPCIHHGLEDENLNNKKRKPLIHFSLESYLEK